MNRKKTLMFSIILIVSIYIGIEALSFVGLIVLKKLKHIGYSPVISSLSANQEKIIHNFLAMPQTGYGRQHPELGWTIRKNGVRLDNLYIANSQGIRADKEYSIMPLKKVIRISAFGDSFTHGDDVSNENTWQEQLNKKNPGYEVLNFGVYAYGLDQSYLRYMKEGTLFKSDIVLIGFMSENIYRNVNVFRNFYSNSYTNIVFTKPRFTVRGDELVLYGNPLSRPEDYEKLLRNQQSVLSEIGEKDYHYQLRYKEGKYDFLPSIRFAKIADYFIKKKFGDFIVEKNNAYYVKSEAFLVTAKIFDAFYRDALNNASLPIIILYPNKDDVIRFLKNKTKKYQPLIEYFESNNYVYIDLLDALAGVGTSSDISKYFTGRWSHYSPSGNKIVARYIERFLINNKMNTKENIKEALKEVKKRRLNTER